MASAHPNFDQFVDTVAQLRAPDGGCPWNLAQTHESIGDYFIEETYEALDAIQTGDSQHLQEELGDVLLQVVLHSQIAQDEGAFTIDDVCRTINDKMVRRHPHVFADASANDANEVSDLWEQIKLMEKETAEQTKKNQEQKYLLDDVPTHFPALLQAQKISRKAAAAGFEWESVDDVWEKVDEERGELEYAYTLAPKDSEGRMLADESENTAKDTNTLEGKSDKVKRNPLVVDAEMEFGDLLFALVNVGRKMGIDAEAALRASNAKFRRRFAAIEDAARVQGRTIEELSQSEMETLWQKAKESE